MTPSLRMRVVEAGARDIANALANIAYNRGWPSEHPNEYLTIGRALAGHALDAMLDVLAEEFPDGDEAAFLAYLREDR